MVIVVALGNPEPEYSNTRHNVARMMFERLTQDIISRGGSVEEWRSDKLKKGSWTNARIPEGKNGEKALEFKLIKPHTYMNLSGECVRKFIETPEDREALIVVHDELDMPLGSTKIAYARGAGGHNGVQSVIEHLGNRDFARIRIGIAPKDGEGRATRDPYKSGADFVLEKFAPEEMVEVNESLKRAVDMTFAIGREGVGEAMNKYN